MYLSVSVQLNSSREFGSEPSPAEKLSNGFVSGSALDLPGQTLIICMLTGE